MLGTPGGFVAVDVAVDLCGALAEPAGVRRELLDLAVVVEGVAACRERGPELGVAHHRGVTDPVERLDAVDDTDRVQSAPGPAREDPCVDLEVEVTVRVTGARRVVPDDCGLELLDGDLDLSAARADARRRVLRDPPDDLLGGAVLGSVVGVGNLGMESCGERPGLGAVDDDLDEPKCMVVVTQSALRLAGGDVVARDPPFVRRPVHGPSGYCMPGAVAMERNETTSR